MIFLKKVINSVVKTSPPKGDNPLPLQAPAAGAGRGCALRVLGVFFFLCIFKKCLNSSIPKLCLTEFFFFLRF